MARRLHREFLHRFDQLRAAMRTLRLTVAYDGSAYAGWQWQPQQKTVQGAIEDALARVTGESTRVVASGRTDTGVHALGQVVAFQTDTRLSNEVLARALNAELPDDVAVLDIKPARDGFDPIREAVRKRYRYVIHDGTGRDVFRRRYCWHIKWRLDVEAMQRAALALLGKHDFRSFETDWPSRVSSVRTVYVLDVRRGTDDEADLVMFEVEADGFLYNMVRNIVGTLVEVGRGNEPESWPGEVLAAGDRREAGPKAPAHGLFLVRVVYDE